MAVRARDIGLRAASAVVLAPAAVLAIWAGGLWFLALMLLACALLAVEWAMTKAETVQARPLAVSTSLSQISSTAGQPR